MADRGGIPWRSASAWSGAATAALGLLTLGSGQPVLEGLAAALSNGLVLFFLLIGIQVVTTHRHSVAVVACSAASATLATVLAVRLAAVAAGAGGPFGHAVDTVVDVAFRSTIVFVVVTLTGRWSTGTSPH